jgi:hypothetical protein
MTNRRAGYSSEFIEYLRALPVERGRGTATGLEIDQTTDTVNDLIMDVGFELEAYDTWEHRSKTLLRRALATA